MSNLDFRQLFKVICVVVENRGFPSLQNFAVCQTLVDRLDSEEKKPLPTLKQNPIIFLVPNGCSRFFLIIPLFKDYGFLKDKDNCRDIDVSFISKELSATLYDQEKKHFNCVQLKEFVSSQTNGKLKLRKQSRIGSIYRTLESLKILSIKDTPFVVWGLDAECYSKYLDLMIFKQLKDSVEQKAGIANPKLMREKAVPQEDPIALLLDKYNQLEQRQIELQNQSQTIQFLLMCIMQGKLNFGVGNANEASSGALDSALDSAMEFPTTTSVEGESEELEPSLIAYTMLEECLAWNDDELEVKLQQILDKQSSDEIEAAEKAPPKVKHTETFLLFKSVMPILWRLKKQESVCFQRLIELELTRGSFNTNQLDIAKYSSTLSKNKKYKELRKYYEARIQN